MRTKKQIALTVILTFFSLFSFGQGGALGNARPAFGALPLGWTSGTPGPLDIRNDLVNQPINFFTQSAQRMTILGGPVGGPTTGFVGIGTISSPTEKLEVESGNINLFTNTNSLMLGSKPILWHKGNALNLFVGIGAGAGHSGGASNNSYFGSNAGFIGNGATTFNKNNTFLGSQAGYNNDGGENVFVGYRSAFGITGINTNGLTAVGTYAGETGTQNGETVFVGYEAGRYTLSTSNCFVGYAAGRNSTSGSSNAFFGTAAGGNNTLYDYNTYVGAGSGANSNGHKNTCVGKSSGQLGVGNRNVLLGFNTMSSANSGSQNVIIGSDANSTTIGNNFNTMVGTDAGLIYTTGDKNTFIGHQSAKNQTTGHYNTYLGNNTGNILLSGNKNTFIGTNADATLGVTLLNNATAIGADANVTHDNHMILGNNNVNVGIGLSADATGPQNKLEINTAALTPVPGASGLRFRDLTSGSSPITNPGTGVLSVDVNGDVIYVDKGISNSLGNVCGTTSNPLPNNWEIPLNGQNFNFTDIANSASSMHIGNPSCSTTLGRLNVYNDNLGIAGAFSSNLNTTTTSFGVNSSITNSGIGSVISVQGTANSTNAGGTARGLRGEAISNNGLLAEGVKGISISNNNCRQNIAVGGLAANGAAFSISGDFDVEVSNSGLNEGVNIEVINGTNSSAINYGINSQAITVGSINFGGYFEADGAHVNYGVYGVSSASGSNPPSGPNYAGYFDGDVVRTGTDNFTSDANLKQNFDTIINALGIINQLKPKTYEYKQSSFPSMNLPGGKQYGLIAQDVQLILPELVNNNTHPPKLDSVGNIIVPSFNYLSLEYQQLTGIIIKAIQEQQVKIDSLTNVINLKDSLQNARLLALENTINQCCSNTSARKSNSTMNQVDIELSDKDAIVLNQNVPNPFAEQTTIAYNVPESVSKAQLIFFNSNGQVIQTLDIKTRGKGRVNVFAADLSSGLYHYTLVADGKVVDSKKMVRE